MLDYSIAAVVAAAYFALQLQDRAGDFLCLRRQSFLLRREALAGYPALHQSFIEVLQPLVKPGFPALEGLQLSLRLFAVKLPLLLPCLQETVYADGVLGIDLYYQDEYVENVRAKASIKLINPKGYTMVCLLTPDSDYTLTAAGGGSITLFDGWDASVFSGDSKVCVIPWQLAGDGEYIEIDNGNFSVNLRVIGTHTGPANNIYCPFHAMDFHDGQSYMVTADACSFDIKDARRLDEAKAALYEVFADLSTVDQSGIRPAFAVRINDDILRNTLEEIRGNIRTLHLLVPVLLFIEGAVSFFAAYLSTQSRLREYAVMRCLGMTRGRIFRLTFCEYFMLAIVGAAFGTVTGIAITGTLSPQMLLYGAGAVSAFMIGTSMSISRITRINVMMLMKTEE